MKKLLVFAAAIYVLITAMCVSTVYSAEVAHWVNFAYVQTDKGLSIPIYYFTDIKYPPEDKMHRFPAVLVKAQYDNNKNYYVVMISCDYNDYVTKMINLNQPNIKYPWKGPFAITKDDPVSLLFHQFCLTLT